MIREGDEGDYYYVIESGRFQVERLVGGAQVVLAELKSGDAFGEEALVSEAKRNASVTALGGGLAAAPGSRPFRRDAARAAAAAHGLRRRGGEACGAARSGSTCAIPRSTSTTSCPGAINVPLAEVRNMFAVLDRRKEYIAYCQSGRRSAAAAFLFAQRGFRVWLLEGGLKAVERPEIR